MLFNNETRTTALHAWRALPSHERRAEGDNILFEERVSPARLQRFESVAPDTPSPTSLRQWQKDYCETYVEKDDPDTFRDDLAPARLVPGLVDADQRIVRLEKVSIAALNEAGRTFDELVRAHDARDDAVLDVFLRGWNARRDGRPAFAAWKDELIGDLRFPDWADRLRDRLGMAHHDPTPANPIPVILMEYCAADVLRAAARIGVRHAFVSPTVLDSPPWRWFFPSPAGLPSGRTMNLGAGSPGLLAEFLHVGMKYTRDHIAKLGHIVRPVPAIGMRDLRNRHLAWVRAASGRPDFGEEMS